MKLVTVKMPDLYVEGIDLLVLSGKYSTRSEVIREAIRRLLEEEGVFERLSRKILDEDDNKNVRRIRVG